MAISTRNALRGALTLINRRDKFILSIVVVAQTLLAFFDLAGIALIGLVVTLGASNISDSPSLFAQNFLQATGLSGVKLSDLLLWLSVVAGILLIAKSVISYLITRGAYRFLAIRQAVISKELIAKLLTRPLLYVQQRTSQDSSYALLGGVYNAIIGVLGSAVSVASELPVLVVVVIGLSFVDFGVTIFTIVFFGSIGILIHKVLSGKAHKLGRLIASVEIESLEGIQEVVSSYREITVLGRREFYIEKIGALRLTASRTLGSLVSINQATKYIYEIMLIVGGGLLLSIQMAFHDIASAVTVISVFLAAASRLMPSLLRMQTAGITLAASSGSAEPTILLANELRQAGHIEISAERETSLYEKNEHARRIEDDSEFSGDIQISNIGFTYPGATEPAISMLSFGLKEGESLALVGPTGAGKSTVADIILGLIKPERGDVRISGLPPSSVIDAFPGFISYVPQLISVARGTIRDNVALGITPELIDDELVWEALERAQLADFLKSSRAGLETQVGERGVQLSGGQRQRLGLARALYSRPKLLLLDEATSALDAETEAAITEALTNLEGEVTTITIAHRLATIRNCDLIIYLENGREVSRGNFEQLRKNSPEFNEQATLSGL